MTKFSQKSCKQKIIKVTTVDREKPSDLKYKNFVK